jgi:Protein of unknown function (DUF2510)
MTSPQTPAGWYPDPSGSGRQRYWDGSQWTEQYDGGGGGTAPAAAGPGGYAAARQDATPPPLFWAGPIAALLAVIGSLGSWVKVEVSAFGQSASESANGTEGDGTITLIIALICGGLLGAWVATRNRIFAFIAAGLAGIGFLLALYHALDPDTTEDLPNFPGLEVSAGWGVWLTTLAMLVLTVVSVLMALRKDANA